MEWNGMCDIPRETIWCKRKFKQIKYIARNSNNIAISQILKFNIIDWPIFLNRLINKIYKKISEFLFKTIVDQEQLKLCATYNIQERMDVQVKSEKIFEFL